MGWSWRSITKPFEPGTINHSFSGEAKWYEGALTASGIGLGIGYAIADNAAQNATTKAIQDYIGNPDATSGDDWNGFERNFGRIENDLAQDAVREANEAMQTSGAAKTSAIGIGVLILAVAVWVWWKKRKKK